MYYFNARWYDPTLGKFITEDPARAGDNWYAYCNNNPLNFIDPTGLEPHGSNDADGYPKPAKDNFFISAFKNSDHTFKQRAMDASKSLNSNLTPYAKVFAMVYAGDIPKEIDPSGTISTGVAVTSIISSIKNPGALIKGISQELKAVSKSASKVASNVEAETNVLVSTEKISDKFANRDIYAGWDPDAKALDIRARTELGEDQSKVYWDDERQTMVISFEEGIGPGSLYGTDPWNNPIRIEQGKGRSPLIDTSKIENMKLTLPE